MTSSPEPGGAAPSQSPLEKQGAQGDDRAPLSYADLRRFGVLLLGLGLAAVLLRALGQIALIFVFAFFVAMVLNPVVVWLERRRLPRGLAVLLTMLALIGTIVGVGFLVVPPVVQQSALLAKNAGRNSQAVQQQAMGLLDRFPSLRQLLPPEIRDSKDSNAISQQLAPDIQKRLRAFLQDAAPKVGRDVLASTLGLLKKLFIGIVTLLMVAFTLANPKPLVSRGLALVPARHRDAAGRSFARLETQMLAWMRATLINGVIVGISTTVLLHFIGLPSVLVFGVLSFFGEFVPTIGPIVASVPALFVAAGQGGHTFLLTLAAILFVQQVETHLLVPFVMGRELELHPVTIVFFALSMAELFGLTGAVLAVPAAALSKILLDEFIFRPQNTPLDSLDKSAASLIENRRWPA